MSGWTKHQIPGAMATCLGFLAASATPPAGIALVGFLNSGELGALVGGFLIFYMYSAPVTLVFAAPAYLLLRLFAPARSRWVLGIGILFGATVGAVVAITVGFAPPDVDLLLYTAMGAASGLVFWLVWRLGVREARALGWTLWRRIRRPRIAQRATNVPGNRK